MTINDFIKGDIIVRVEPAAPYSSGVCDRSYIGEPIVFLGTANGCMYGEFYEPGTWIVNSDMSLRLPIDCFSDGWDYYETPPASRNSRESVVDDFRKMMQEALSKEDYELLNEFKNVLDGI